MTEFGTPRLPAQGAEPRKTWSILSRSDAMCASLALPAAIPGTLYV